MSEPDPRLDELLSTHLDGETTADEAARIEADPTLRARLSALAAARDALAAESPTVDDVTREHTLAQVFATLDRDDPAPSLTPVSQLSRRRRDPSRFLAAAAAVIAVVLLGGAIGMLARESGGDSGGDSAATEMSTKDDDGSEASATMSEQGAGSSSADEAPQAGSTPFSSTSAAPSLGQFDDTAQLAATVRERFLETRAPHDTDATAGRDGQLSATPPGCPAQTGSLAVYSADVDGQTLLVVLTDQQVALVLDPTTCTEVLRITRQ